MIFLKFFITTLLIFAPGVALAAQPIKGTVPVLVPLQPPPAGVDFDRANPLNSPPVEEDLSEEGVLVGTSDSEFVETQKVSGRDSSKGSGGYKVLLFSIITLALAFFGVYYWRKGAK
ncbi:MAG: hypothetical protein JNN11_05250 [Candidatus Doudnabacteria bacterium]|nr:hypothetical protein [Candidatus Doudnabacteria bacterium]